MNYRSLPIRASLTGAINQRHQKYDGGESEGKSQDYETNAISNESSCCIFICYLGTELLSITA